MGAPRGTTFIVARPLLTFAAQFGGVSGPISAKPQLLIGQKRGGHF